MYICLLFFYYFCIIIYLIIFILFVETTLTYFDRHKWRTNELKVIKFKLNDEPLLYKLKKKNIMNNTP